MPLDHRLRFSYKLVWLVAAILWRAAVSASDAAAAVPAAGQATVPIETVIIAYDGRQRNPAMLRDGIQSHYLRGSTPSAKSRALSSASANNGKGRVKGPGGGGWVDVAMEAGTSERHVLDVCGLGLGRLPAILKAPTEASCPSAIFALNITRSSWAPCNINITVTVVEAVARRAACTLELLPATGEPPPVTVRITVDAAGDTGQQDSGNGNGGGGKAAGGGGAWVRLTGPFSKTASGSSTTLDGDFGGLSETTVIIIAAAAGGGSLLLLALVVAWCLCRRSRARAQMMMAAGMVGVPSSAGLAGAKHIAAGYRKANTVEDKDRGRRGLLRDDGTYVPWSAQTTGYSTI